MSNCPCGTSLPLSECCQPIIDGSKNAPTAESLMRARYTAHAIQNYDFIAESAHPEFREDAKPEEIEEWSSVMEWTSLEILETKDGGPDDETGEVSFCANYKVKGFPQELREDSFFRKEDGKWYYVEGTIKGKEPFKREIPKLGRNDNCHCGSGKKYKKCCMNKESV